MRQSYDAIVIGAGFGGLYALMRLRDHLKLDVLLIEQGSGVGGTWFWNRYPGAMSDTRSHLYCYSFDRELLQEDEFTSHYRHQPEVLSYLEKFADRYNLRPNIQLNTEMTGAAWDEANESWRVTTSSGKVLSARFVITAVGLLSKPNVPPIKGADRFEGEVVHTARWPENTSCEGKRVGIIGTGSTGVQVVTAIGPIVKHLTVFQRSPQYSVPSGNGRVPEEFIRDIKNRYDEIWEQEKASLTAFGAKESNISALSVSPDERERIFEEAWQEGGGFRFMFGTFNDVIVSEESNELAAAFIRKKISQIVKDPERARKLTPVDLYAKRPLCDAGYFEQFNRPNVDVVDIKENPIAEITPKGIRTADGVEHELDMIIYATGFDAVDGNYLRLNLKGVDGVSIQDHWREGARTFLGIFSAKFPNMFMVLGPNSPFSNLPPAIETQIDLITEVIEEAIKRGATRIEAREKAVEEWVEECRQLAEATVLPRAKSWIFGANIPGKPYTLSFHMGGLSGYRKILDEVREQEFAGLRMT